MKNILTTLSLFLITLSFSQPKQSLQYNLNQEIPKDTTAVRGLLPNGLKYFIKENNRPKDVVYLHLIVKAGHLNEDEKQLGLAHLLEHMGFNGTKHFKKNKLVKYLESIGMKFGSDLNAHTGHYETVYKLKVPSKNLKKVEKAFQILEDWSHNMLLEEAAINQERPVVLEEFRGRLGSGNRITNKIVEFMYPNMPHSRYFGDEKLENIKRFKTEDLRRYYKEWYRPDLMGVIVVGDINPEFAEDQIKKHFSKLINPVNKKQITINDSVPYHKEPRVKVITDPETTRTSISLNFINLSPVKEEKTLIKHQRDLLASNMLFSMINNRLRELSNEKEPPFLGASVGLGSTISKYHHKFYIGAASHEADVQKALKHLMITLEQVKRYGFVKEELDRVKKDILANNEAFLSDKDNWYSKNYLNYLKQEFFDDWVLFSKDWYYAYNKSIVPEITLKDVKDIFMSYYRKDNRVLLVTAPEKEGFVLPTKQALLSVIDKAETDSKITAYVPKKIGNQLVENLRTKGDIDLEEDYDKNIKKLELSNGATVFYKKTDFDKEQIKFKAFSYGGRSLLSNEENKSIGSLMSIVKSTGIGGYKHHELSKLLTGKKAKVSSYVANYDEGLKGSARAKDLETMFKLIYLNFTSINNDEETYLNIVKKIKEGIKNRKLKPATTFYNKIRELYNTGNPRYINMDKDRNLERFLDSIPYKNLYKAYTKRFDNAGDFKFLFIGDFDEAILKDYVKTYIASLPSVDEREEGKLSTYKNILSGERLEVYKGLEDKATLLIEFTKEAKHNLREKEALRLFGEVYQKRLRNRIREEKGGIYTLRANFKHIGRPYPRYYASVRFNCSPENIDALEEESLLVLEDLQKRGPTKKEVENVKKNWVLGREKVLEGNNFWLNHMYNKVYWKQTLGEGTGLEDYQEKLEQITPKYIKKVANKYVDKPSLIAKLLPEKKGEASNRIESK